MSNTMYSEAGCGSPPPLLPKQDFRNKHEKAFQRFFSAEG